MELYKVLVLVKDEPEEVPVWASSLEEAHDTAEAEYDEVLRVRPVVVAQ